MTRIVRCILLIAVTSIVTPCQGAEAILRPDTAALAREIDAASSLMSHDTLLAGERAVVDLDRRVLAFARSQGVAVGFGKGWRRRVDELTTALPTGTPDGERLLLYTIRLQIEMLDAVLAKRDSSLREQLRRDRTMVRVASPQRDKIFGDARDRYVAEMIRSLTELEALQEALGAGPALPIQLPVGRGEMRAVETYVLDQIKGAAMRAAKVR